MFTHTIFIFIILSTTQGLYLNDDIIDTILMNQQEIKKIVRKRFKNIEDETSSMKMDLMEIKASIQILSEKVDQISESYSIDTIQLVSTETQNPEVPEVANLVMLSHVPEIKIWNNTGEEFQNKMFSGGETINLHCKVHILQNGSQNDITWFKNDEMLFDSHSSTGDHKIRVSHSSNEIQSFLQLRNASQNHSGSYYCLSNGIMSTKVDIIVIDTIVEVKKMRDEIVGMSSLMRKINDTVIDGQQQLLEMLKIFKSVKNSNSSILYEAEPEINHTANYTQLFGINKTDKSTREMPEEVNSTIITELANSTDLTKCNTTHIELKEIQVQELINNQTYLRSIVHKYSRKIEEIQKHLLEEKKHHCNHPFVWIDEAQVCLYFSISTMKWDSARLACKSLDSRSDLAVIPDPIALRSYMMASKLYNYFYLIGGTDRGSPRSFYWINGSPVTSGWDSNEPHNNVPGNNCIWIYKYGYIGDVGHDLGCNTDHYRFICQK